MIKAIIFIIIILNCQYPLISQNLKSPAELMQMLNQSTMVYKLISFSKESDIENHRNLLSSRISLFPSDNNLYIALDFIDVLKDDSLAYYYYKKAQENFQHKLYRNSIEYYKKVLKIYPTISQIMAYIGHCYLYLNQQDSAIYWVSRSIQINYYDYFSHWLLSDLLYKVGNIKEAINEGLIAHILNRNDIEIIKSLNKYFNSFNYAFSSDIFRKPLRIEKNSYDSTILCFFDFSEHPSWMSYLLYKALWRYEPGYREKMIAHSKLPDFLLEERECVFQMISAYYNIKNNEHDKNVDIKENELVEQLIDASKNGYLNEMLLYELVLPEHPDFVYYINHDFMKGIIRYIWNYRVTRQLTALY